MRDVDAGDEHVRQPAILRTPRISRIQGLKLPFVSPYSYPLRFLQEDPQVPAIAIVRGGRKLVVVLQVLVPSGEAG